MPPPPRDWMCFKAPGLFMELELEFNMPALKTRKAGMLN
jgi:hypothetical protein